MMLPWLLLLVACRSPAPAPEEVVFLRGAVALPSTAAPGGRPLGDGRWLLEHAWEPNRPLSVHGHELWAPARAECLTLFTAALGDVSRHVARGGAAPDTALAFSPDGAWLAVGTFRGEVLLLDAWTGEIVARRRFPEAVVKQVAFSPEGHRLYVGEQSPEASLHALDLPDLASAWTVPLSAEVGRGTPPARDDLYGLYTLPAAFALHVLPEGDLVVGAVRGWVDGEGLRRNRSRLLRMDPTGRVVAAWPPGGSADATLLFPRLDVAGGRVAVGVTRSADGEPPADLPVDGVQILALDALAPVATFQEAPLEPWFERVFLWDGLDLDSGRDLAITGLGDGRLVLWRPGDGSRRAVLPLGVPVEAAEVPIATSIGFARLLDGRVLATTSGTNIPYGAASPALRPPAPHPGENTLWEHDAQGRPLWRWRGPYALQGMTLGPDGRTLVVGAGVRETDTRRDLFGALVFDLDAPPEARLWATCPTAGPVTFGQAVSADGRIAVVEHPWREGERVLGAYRVTVFR